MTLRTVTLLLLTVAALPAVAHAQTPCYRPDGSMYVGVQPPADCSPTRPKARDEAIEQSRTEPRPTVKPTDAPSPRDEAIIQAEVAQRVQRMQSSREANDKAMRAIKSCDAYKYSPSSMNEEQAALCYRVWGEKANRTLGR
jgi:hypothetical protein